MHLKILQVIKTVFKQYLFYAISVYSLLILITPNILFKILKEYIIMYVRVHSSKTF